MTAAEGPSDPVGIACVVLDPFPEENKLPILKQPVTDVAAKITAVAKRYLLKILVFISRPPFLKFKAFIVLSSLSLLIR